MSTESDFIREVEAGFPYDDARAAAALIQRACAVSANAAFTIPYELAAQRRAEPETLLLLLDIWSKCFNHPLKALVLRFAQALIGAEALEKSVVLDAMDIVAKFPGQYQALNVIYFTHRDPELDAAYDDILSVWDSEPE